jgi:hypothetical protein
MLSANNECFEDRMLVAIVRILRVADEATHITRHTPINPSQAGPTLQYIAALQLSLGQVKHSLEFDLLQNSERNALE